MATIWDIVAGREGRVWYDTEMPEERPQTPAGGSGPIPTRRTFIDRSQLTDRANRWLDIQVPSSLTPDDLQKIRGVVVAKLPNLTKARGAIEASRAAAAQREAAIPQAQPRRTGVLEQFAEGTAETFPGAEWLKTEQPAPATLPQRAARMVGQVAGFAVPAVAFSELAVPAKVLEGVAGPARLALSAARGAVGPAVVGALQEGTPQQRLARGATMAVAGAVTGPAAEAIGGGAVGAVARRQAPAFARAVTTEAQEMEAQLLARGVSPAVAREAAARQAAGRIATAARNVGAVRGAVQEAAGAATAGATFGAAQPWAESYWRRKMGEDVPPVTLADMGRGAAQVGAFGLLTAAAAGARAARGMRGGGAEVPRETPGLPGGAPPPEAAPPPPTPAGPERPIGPVMGSPLPGRGESIVGRYARPMRGPVNPLFGGRSQIEIFRDQVAAGLRATGKPHDQLDESDVGRASARAARFAQKAEVLRSTLLADVPLIHQRDYATATAGTDKLLVGKELTVQAPELGLQPVPVRVVKTFFYPWDTQTGFRVLVEDPATGDMAPLVYPTPEAFSQAIPATAPAAPVTVPGSVGTPTPERGPAGTLPGILSPAEETGAAPPGARPVEGAPAPQQPPAPVSEAAPKPGEPAAPLRERRIAPRLGPTFTPEERAGYLRYIGQEVTPTSGRLKGKKVLVRKLRDTEAGPRFQVMFPDRTETFVDAADITGAAPSPPVEEPAQPGEREAEILKRVNTEAGNATTLPTDNIPAFESMLEKDGWERFTRGKGEFWRKGERELFIRSQGKTGKPIVQWEGKEEAPTPAAPPHEPTDAEIDEALSHPQIKPEWERMQREGATDAQLEALLNRALALREAEKAGPASAMATVRGAGGEERAVAGFDPSILRKLSAKMYEGNLGKIVVKELLQNSADAVRGQPDGKVDVRVDTIDRTFSIEDNGSGMAPETVKRELVDLGASLKPQGASGGFGLAKAALFANAAEIHVQTVADTKQPGVFGQRTVRVETTMTGSGADWMDPTKGLSLSTIPAGGQPTGTKMFIRLARAHPDGTPIQISENQVHSFLESFVTHQGSIPNLTVTVDGKPITPAPGKIESVNKIKTQGAEVELFAGGKEEETPGYVNVLVMNTGLPQFSAVFMTGTGSVPMPSRIVVDVRPTVPADHAAYPFTTSREAVTADVQTVVSGMIRKLATESSSREKKLYQDTINNAPKTKQGFRVVDTSGRLPKGIAEAMASHPSIDAMAKLFEDAATDFLKLLEERAGAYAPVRLEPLGIGLGRGYLGVNINGAAIGTPNAANVILINPFTVLEEALGMQRQGEIGPNEIDVIRCMAEQIVAGTIPHELAHQRYRDHDVTHDGEVTRLAGILARHYAPFLDDLEIILNEPNFYSLLEHWRDAIDKALASQPPDIFAKAGVHAATAGRLRAPGEAGGGAEGGARPGGPLQRGAEGEAAGLPAGAAAGGGAASRIARLRARHKIRPLEQTSFDVGPRELPVAGTPATVEGARAVEAMGEPVRTFTDAFRELVIGGASPEEARDQAEKLSGQPAPRGFDADARARAALAAESERRGQGMLFGAEAMKPPAAAPEPAPAARGGAPVASERGPEGAVVEAPQGAPSGKWTRGETDVLTLDFHGPFQNRSIEEMGGFTDPEYIQSLLRKSELNPEGGFNRELLEREPIMFWTDMKGEIGPAGKRYAISHHRTELARNQWVEEGGRFVSKGPMRRTVPTLEFHGSYEDAVKVAQDVNRTTRPNTYVEDAARAKKIVAAGGDVQRVADSLKLSKGKAQELLDFGNLTPDVQAALGSTELRGFGVALGKAAGRHPAYYVPDVQRSYVAKIATGYFANPEHLKEVLRARAAVLDEWPQERIFDMPTDEQLMRAYGRAAKRLADRKALAARIKTYEKLLADKGPQGATLAAAAKEHLEIARPRLETYNKIARDYSIEKIVGRLTAAHARGQSLNDVADKIGQEIDRLLGPPGPEDWGKGPFVLPPLMVGIGGFNLDALANMPSAVMRQVARSGRRVRELLDVARGREVTPRLGPPSEPDYWNLYATWRALHWPGLYGYPAKLGLGGGDAILPTEFTLPRDIAGLGKRGDRVNLRRMWRDVEPVRNNSIEEANEILHMILGDEGIQLLEKHTETGRLFARALDGQQEAIDALPPVLKRALPLVSELWHSLLTKVQEAQGRRNAEIPGRIKDYFPHTLYGLTPEGQQRNLEAIEGRPLSSAEFKDRVARIYMQREGFQPGELDFDFMTGWQSWLNIAFSKMAIDPAMEATRAWLESEGTKPGNVERAGQVRNWVQSFWMRRQSEIEQRANAFWRRVAFAQSRGDLKPITEEQAVAWTSQAAVLKGAEGVGKKLEHFVAVLKGKGVAFTDPNSWTKLGERAGMDIYGGANGVAYTQPVLKMPLRALHMARTEIPAWLALLSRHWAGRFPKAERTRRMLERRAAVMKWERDPVGMFSAKMSGVAGVSVMDSIGTAFVNALQPILTTLPHHGFVATGVGAARSLEVTLRALTRRLIAGAGRIGLLSKEQAAHYEKNVKLMAQEIALDALSMRQGEAFFLEKMVDDIAAGRGPTQRAILSVLRPMGFQAISEALSRGLDLQAAWASGMAQGLSPGRVGRYYENSVAGRWQARQDMIAELLGGGERNLMEYLRRTAHLNMYDYGPMGQGFYMNHPSGRVFGSLSTFLANNLMKQALRQLEGAARAAAGQAAGDTPDAREYRQAALEMLRTLLIVGLLGLLSDRTRTNFMVAGVPSYAILLLKATRGLFSSQREYKEWLERAVAGETTPIFAFNRPEYARGPAWASPVGSLLYGWKAGFKQSALEMLRWAAFNKIKLPEWKKLISQRPDLFGPGKEYHWMAEVFGVKTFYRTTPEQRGKRELRLLDPTEQQQTRIHYPPTPEQRRKARQHRLENPPHRRGAAGAF